ncbi:MAG TPA: DeoR/GlpR family DNA-binding transcription regulator [Chloroflexia bacterium]|nr:DeoR/GlpR family DNA-binding transcription regulator [Chloroflexia bacterium]
MLKEERQQLILQKLHQDGKVLALELSQDLNVSEDTIRRDLRDLAEMGQVQRVHGGALLRSPVSPDYSARRNEAVPAKIEIARAALPLLRDGQVIFMDGGTTTLQIAQCLPANLNATIVTNSPPIAVALAEYPEVEVILIGGQLYKKALATVGAVAIEAFRSIRADICLLGICSLHPETGITVFNYEEAQVKKAMIASAAEVVAVAAAEKLNTAAPYIVGPLSDLTHLVTERNTPEEYLKPFHKLGVTIIT